MARTKTEHIRLEIADGVATITFARPHIKNSLNVDALKELFEAMGTAEDRRDVGCVVLTGEGDAFTPEKTVPLKPGDYMRHPAGGHHYDGGLDEEAVVAISGYGPTSATVIDGGELFGKSR